MCTPSCILSKFYIKPQLTGRTLNGFDGCILSKFYIKPQPVGPGKTVKLCCILSKFYIKPQHSYQCPFLFVVVSYRNSTSNHNRARTAETSKRLYLIEILHQTTTGAGFCLNDVRLYLIEILHQTTTLSRFLFTRPALYLIEILHQTTTVRPPFPVLPRCILSKFYIKPQLKLSLLVCLIVVSYRNSTSNHNLFQINNVSH